MTRPLFQVHSACRVAVARGRSLKKCKVVTSREQARALQAIAHAAVM